MSYAGLRRDRALWPVGIGMRTTPRDANKRQQLAKQLRLSWQLEYSYALVARAEVACALLLHDQRGFLRCDPLPSGVRKPFRVLLKQRSYMR